MRPALLPLILAAVAARAQEPPPPPPPAELRLTQDEAVERALAAAPALVRLQALVGAADAQSDAARAQRWPHVELGAGYQRRSEVPELAIFTPTGDPTQPVERVVVFPNIQDNWRVRAGLSLPLYTGGRTRGEIESADESRAAADFDLRAGRADLVLETKRAYWALVTAREDARVLQESMRAYDAHFADARNREQVGMAARNEVLAVEVERDRVELDKLRAEANADVAEANLRRLLDLPPSTRVVPSEPLEGRPVPRPDLEALVAEAQGLRPERQALVARAAAADATARAERGARLPQLAVSGGYFYDNPNREIIPPTADWKDTWDIGVGVSWSLFDGGRRRASQARAHAYADAAREDLREFDRRLRLEVTESTLELRTAEARLAVAERSVVSAAESRRVAADRSRAGVLPSSELTDAEVAHERAARARTEALAELRVASARLERAVGR
ncbi:MAG: TolC family protein [Burkholderiales bacterium]